MALDPNDVIQERTGSSVAGPRGMVGLTTVRVTHTPTGISTSRTSVAPDLTTPQLLDDLERLVVEAHARGT